MIDPKWVQFKTEDGLTLPGLLFQADESKTVMIHLHGMGGSVFYDGGKLQAIAQSLDKKNISFFPFNNRGAELIKNFDVQKNGQEVEELYGMSYEVIKDCVLDINGAIAYLKKLGFKTFYLSGHSTGANKICVYNYYQPKNPIKKYIILGGGDDTGIYYQELGNHKFHQFLKIAYTKIKKGQGKTLMIELFPQIYSYQAFFDIANPNGDYNTFPFFEEISGVKLASKPLFNYFQEIKKPALVIYGSDDNYSPKPIQKTIDILRNYQPGFEYQIIQNADHGFRGYEQELADVIVSWL